MRKIGIIGAGTVVEKNYANVLTNISNATVVAVSDVNDRRSQYIAAKFGASSVSAEEVIDSSDIIFIATPPDSHFDLVSKCISAKKDVFCEKPFVPSVREADLLVAAALASDVKIYVGHFRRTFPAVELARSLITSGAFGAVQEITAIEGGRFTWRAESEYTTKSQVGGVLFDTGSHTIDMALYACGLDTVRGSWKVSEATANCPEPSTEIQFLARLADSASDVTLRAKLSRLESLANCVQVRCTSAFVIFSTGLRNSIKVVGPSGASIIETDRRPTDLLQCMEWQFGDVINGTGERFIASRFRNVTALLECVAGSVEVACA